MDINVKDLLAVIILVALIGTGGYFLSSQGKKSGLSAATIEIGPAPAADTGLLIMPSPMVKNSPDQDAETIVVCIAGGVLQPGLYQVPASIRLFELVDRAGGFSSRAVYENLNPARKLQDGDKIIIPERINRTMMRNRMIDERDLLVYAAEREQRQETEKDPAAVPASVGALPAANENSMININTAPQADLEKLPRIGPATAQAIINYRDKHRGFKHIEELMEVPRIGEKTFAGLRERVTL